MICHPNEAKNYLCCMMDKPCEGHACMAWKVHFIPEPHIHSEASARGNIMYLAPQPLVASDKGYCGMVR